MVLVATVDLAARQARTYGNWRKPSSAGLKGLGSVGTAILLIGMILVILVVMARGMLAAAITALVVAAVLGLLLFRDAHGKNLATKASARVGFAAAKQRGSHLYRSGPASRHPWGTHQLPGLAAPMRLSEFRDSYNRPFGLIFTPATGHYAVVFGTEPSGASLVDPEQVDSWVADWGHWLANLSDEPSLEAASVTVETAPDSGTRLRREVNTQIDENANEFSKAVLRQTVADYPAGSSTVRAYVSLTFSAAPRPGAKKRTPEEMARDLASRLPGLTQDLQMTGAGAARPLSGQQICEVVRIAYDPASAAIIDDAYAEGHTPELDWSDVGPSAHQTSWDSYRHDSGHSVTWAMTSAPRGHVQSAILRRLLSPHADVMRKRVTLLYRPISAARAAALVEQDLRNAEFRATSEKKVRARDTLAVRSAAATASEEASGAGLVDFGMVVTATVASTAREAEAVAAVDSLGAATRIRLRRVYGSQDSAFAVALPLGIIPAKHIRIPEELRNNV